MSNQLFNTGDKVYHWDLFMGWDRVEILSYNSETDEYTAVDNHPQYATEFTDHAVFFHATKDIDAISKVLRITARD